MKNTKSNQIWLALINMLLFVLMITVNSLAIILPINNKTTVELSDKYQNLFVPSGSTFSIWSVIFLLLLVFVIYQVVCAFSQKLNHIVPVKSQFVFSLTCILNASWIITWHYEYIGLSVLIMLSLLISLLFLFTSIDKMEGNSLSVNFMLKTPITIYLGWISVATIANITAFLVAINWNRFGISDSTWTIIMLLIGTLLGVLMLKNKQNVTFAFVLIWAYIGILAKRQLDTTPYPILINTLYFCLAILFIYVIITMIKKMMVRYKRN